MENLNKNPIAVLSFYSFINISDSFILQAKILFEAKRKLIRGTILLANEGFNGSISGAEEDLHYLIDKIREITSATDISVKINYCQKQPFSKIKVKLKKEIVALKHGSININRDKGEYIKTQDWKEFIERDDEVTIDTRNDYEVKIGTFDKAINPETESFSELPEWIEKNMSLFQNKKVAMFCTGGIRCEKSTTLMKQYGINDVYHLQGGILQYLEDTKNTNKAWSGKCFVFDDRGAVNDDLTPSEGFWVEKGSTAKAMAKNQL